jgi:hypothetical protein
MVSSIPLDFGATRCVHALRLDQRSKRGANQLSPIGIGSRGRRETMLSLILTVLRCHAEASRHCH